MRDMDQGDWAAVQSLFEDLIDLPPEDQERRLTQSTQPESIVTQARALLTASRDPGILDMAVPTLDQPSRGPGHGSLAEGQTVGGFTVERLIGRGGMGEVYLARRTAADFDQRVALKMLRVEAAERGDLFARERRLLARLEHPGIARLIDAGLAVDGRPYMALEYVDGEPIDAWCRNNAADLDTRLSLLREVCEAVAYAHANLVVHRDIKPSNVLIDKAGKVRLLDFGIAKLLDDTAVPATTQAMLTPDYAAPEQLDGDEATVATDVYALGVMLYELLAGVSPWRRDGASVPAIIRRVLYDDPVLPSKAAARDGAPVPAGRIEGDLDAITMKAMRRRPEERYRGVPDLADDLRRHQESRPVLARDGSRRYMAGRFVRRYRWAVAASAAAIVALLVGSAGIAWQARQTAIERDVALAEARRSEAINRMLNVMFRDTAANSGEGATVKEMLDQTADRLVGSLDTSAKSATLITTLFDLYVNLEDPQAADSLMRRAMAKGIGQGDPVSVAEMKLRLASSSAALGKTEEMAPLLDAAEPVFRRDPERFRQELVEVNTSRAQLLRRTGKIEEAIVLLNRGMPEADRVYAENHRDLLTIYNNLLVYMVEANQLDAMEPVFARAEAAMERTGQQKSALALSIGQLKGVRLLKLERPREAEAIFEKIIAIRRPVFGKSAGLSVDLMHMGRTKLALGKFAEAKALFAEAWPMAMENMGPAAQPTLFMAMGLAEASAETGDLAEADRALTAVTPVIEGSPKVGLNNAMLWRTTALVRLKQGRVGEAAEQADKAEKVFAAGGPSGASYLKSIAALKARIAKAR